MHYPFLSTMLLCCSCSVSASALTLDQIIGDWGIDTPIVMDSFDEQAKAAGMPDGARQNMLRHINGMTDNKHMTITRTKWIEKGVLTRDVAYWTLNIADFQSTGENTCTLMLQDDRGGSRKQFHLTLSPDGHLEWEDSHNIISGGFEHPTCLRIPCKRLPPLVPVAAPPERPKPTP